MIILAIIFSATFKTTNNISNVAPKIGLITQNKKFRVFFKAVIYYTGIPNIDSLQYDIFILFTKKIHLFFQSEF